MKFNNDLYRGQGTHVQGMTIDDMLAKSGLDWKTVPLPVLVQGKSTAREIPGRKALVRSDDGTVLDVVTDDYIPAHNRQIVAAMQRIAEAGEMEITHLGSLNGGRRIFAATKFPEFFSLKTGDPKVGDTVNLSGVMGSGHISGISFSFSGWATRLVCLNGAMVSMAAKASFSMHHVTEFNSSKVDKLRQAVTEIRREFSIYAENAIRLRSIRWQPEIIRQYAVELFQKPLMQKAIEAAKTEFRTRIGSTDSATMKLGDYTEEFNRPVKNVLALMPTQPGASLGPVDSAWNAYNAVTYYVDHVQGRGDSSATESSLFGIGRNLKHEAMELAMAYVRRYNA